MLQELGSNLNYAHEIPPKLPQKSSTSKAQPVNNAEATLKELLLRAGFPKPIAQHSISLGKPLGTTTPDFFYEDPENDLDGICIYLDGLSEPIHG
jgi:hypothetical protein